ncbi:M48 family metallopeptidase [Natronoglomus mannanivorans]|uniref:M48 family metalloprotease n=1 Tax=Natronoglomus mannanivorans TaxID=2979990 RepID=A0AAP2YYV6_9EURY|nr:M48 family metalloprotease [Halobacteria archaeon AArc-xg1-1]
MAVGSGPSLRLRLAGTLAAVVLVNVALLAVLAWGIHTVLTIADVGAGVEPGLVTDLSASLPAVAGVLVLAALLLVLAQARYGYRRVLASVDATPVSGDGDDPDGLTDRVRRLALAADVPEPTVATVDAEDPNSFTVDDGRHATVVVTTGLLETLSDDELDAVLAHEIAHLVNRDATVATVVATISAISDSLFAREKRLGEWIRLLMAIGWHGSVIMLIVAGPVLLLCLAFVLVSGVARLVLAVNGICTGLHAQAREYAADSAAAELVGDPTALAAALETLDGDYPHEDARERDRDRLHASATLGIVPRSIRSVVPDAESESTKSSISQWLPSDDLYGGGWMNENFIVYRAFGRLGRALEWRPATHPPTEARIRRLIESAGDGRGSRVRSDGS